VKYRRRARLLASPFRRVVGLGLWLSLVVTPPALATTTPIQDASFDYLYVESNEGGSSGGHTAIRFGPDVYHFQNENGLLVLRRDLAREFLYTYALLGNRTIHSTRIAVSQNTRAALLDRFRRRHRAQEAQIGIGNALRNDRILLERLRDDENSLAGPSSSPTLSILGLGYFTQSQGRADGSPKTAPNKNSSTTLVSLRDAIIERHGRDFLSVRRHTTLEAMQALFDEDPAGWTVETPTSAYDHPAFERSYSKRWRDLAAGLAALDVLEEARPLEAATHHSPDEPRFSLDPREIRAFERYADELSMRLVGLVDSRRADWGEPLLVGMARLSALNESISKGQLVFLDTFPSNSAILGKHELARRGEISVLMVLENQNQLDASRAYFRDNAGASELAWERVEERSNRFFEIMRAVRGEGPMRIARGHLVPSRAAPYSLPPLQDHRTTLRSEDLERVRERERSYSRALSRLHRYGLIARNCATAIFETINDSFEGSVEISRRRLGGHVRSRHSLAFIPFVSAQQVDARYSVVSTEIIPSYRQLRLRAMRSREPALRVAFRESNIFTSTTYDRSSNDSFFVFFTDDVPLLRPLFGVINLAAAVGQIALGIVTVPIDRGRNLARGLRGVFVSLPELAFANIRKGSNDWIAKEYRILSPVRRWERSDRLTSSPGQAGGIQVTRSKRK